MKVEILYFEGCPTYKRTERTSLRVLSELGTEAELELVAVDTDEEAERLRFPGSPTIRVNGRGLFPTEEREDWRRVPGLRDTRRVERLPDGRHDPRGACLTPGFRSSPSPRTLVPKGPAEV